MRYVPVTLPVADRLPAVSKLPPDTLAVVVIFDVEFRADTTFELRLNPAAFKLPAITLPVAEMLPPALTALAVNMLPPCMLAIAEILPVKPLPMVKLPPKIFPVVLIKPNELV